MQYRFVIYSRNYCHLCEDMRVALLDLLLGEQMEVDMVDVDADSFLVEQYDELVPVLMGRAADGAWVKICHHFLDAKAVNDFVQTSPSVTF